jgi:hypothetical protein
VGCEGKKKTGQGLCFTAEKKRKKKKLRANKNDMNFLGLLNFELLGRGQECRN